MSEAELEAFLIQCAAVFARVGPVVPGFDFTTSVRTGIEANRSLPASERLAGARMAARDCLRMTADLSPSLRGELEASLREAGSPSLHQVRAHVSINLTASSM